MKKAKTSPKLPSLSVTQTTAFSKLLMREDIITGDWMAGCSTLNDKTAVTEDK